MKPFDLDLALQGHPVVTRDGVKAYVTRDNRIDAAKLGIGISSESAISGFVCIGGGGNYQSFGWSEHGLTWTNGNEYPFDIVGMWEEPVPTITIGDVEVPAPLTEEPKFGEEYWTFDLRYSTKSPNCVVEISPSLSARVFGYTNPCVDAGLAFKTKEDAEQAHAALRALMKQQLEKVKEWKK